MSEQTDKGEGTGGRATRDATAFLRAQFAEQKRIATIQPQAPPALLARVSRWFWATVLREFAHQFALITGTLIGLLGAFGGFRHRLGRLAGLGLGGLLVVQLRHAIAAHRSAATIEDALEGLPESEDNRIPLRELALPPLMFVAPEVSRERGVLFSEADGVRLRLDIYRPRELPEGPRPAVIQVHGGGWLSGSRFEQGIPLLNHLAGLGWVGFNIDYRLSPEATWPDHIVDVKRAIAWVREHATELGIDPDQIAITGGSAGGHLTALAGLTANDPAFQPGFEQADTSVIAAVPFYGVYDFTNSSGHYYPQLRSWTFEQVVLKKPLEGNEELYRAASPLFRVHADAPPYMVIHGDRDTLVPVGDARDFAAKLKRVSNSDVRYVELAGAEHAFDLWPSVRSARVADAIGRFLTSLTSNPDSRTTQTPQGDDFVQTAGSTSN